MGMNTDCSIETPPFWHCASKVDPIARIDRLQDTLAVCPMDVVARCELAMLLEKLGQPDKALANWSKVLASDPNNLTAREGMARSRQQSVRSFQSNV